MRINTATFTNLLTAFVSLAKDFNESLSSHFMAGDIVMVIADNHPLCGHTGEVLKEQNGVVTVRIKGLKKMFEVRQLGFVEIGKLL